MKTHLDHLLDVIPDLKSRNVLDLGSGRGSFLIDCAKKGVIAEGLELNKAYIELSFKRAEEAGISVKISSGVGEKLLYKDNTFDFVNLCEVIEHVDSPEKTMQEVYRVLKKDGKVYISVPNRFGLKDQHFNLYFINWMPRLWAEIVLSLLNKHKDYTGTIGFQSLSKMHYMTYKSAKNLFSKHSFSVGDMRLIKIKERFSGFVYYPALFLYYLLRPWYFDSFHFLLTK